MNGLCPTSKTKLTDQDAFITIRIWLAIRGAPENLLRAEASIKMTLFFQQLKHEHSRATSLISQARNSLEK